MEFECIHNKTCMRWVIWDKEAKNTSLLLSTLWSFHHWRMLCTIKGIYRNVFILSATKYITLFSDTNVLQASVGFCRYHRYARIAKHCFSLNFESIRTVIWPQIEQDYFYIINLDRRNIKFPSFHRKAHKLIERIFILLYL